MLVISLRIPHSAGGMSAKQYSVCMIPKISVGCAWFGLSNHICIRPQGDIGMQSNRALSESAKYVVLVRSKTQVSINEKKKEVFKMQEKKENLTMGNSRHTAMGEGAMPTIEQKDVVQAIDQQKQMEDLLNADDVVCAHVYDSNGYSEFLFRMSVENIANFLGARPLVQKMILTDFLDRPILCTVGFFIDQCPDKVLLEEVKRVLIPIQMGEVEAKPIFSPSIGEVVAYQLRQQTEEIDRGADV